MKTTTESWSPDWVSDSIETFQENTTQTLARFFDRAIWIRVIVAVVAVAAGLWLTLNWPAWRSDLGFHFFRSFGSLLKFAYLLLGVIGTFMCLGSLRLVFPRLLATPLYDFFCFAVVMFFVCEHARRYSLIGTAWTGIVAQLAASALPFLGLWLFRNSKIRHVLIGLAVFLLMVFLSYLLIPNFHQDPDAYAQRNAWQVLTAASLLWTFMVSFIFLLIRRTHWSIFWMVTGTTLGSCLILWSISKFGYIRFQHAYMNPGRLWMSAMFLMMEFTFAVSAIPSLQGIKVLLFPAHWMGQVPYFFKQIAVPEKSSLAFARGLVDLVKLAMILWVNYYFNRKWPMQATPIFLTGLIVYLQLYILSWVTFLLPVACGRLLGYNLPDPYNSPLLAANPADRWRRWNTYYYEWFRTILFIPIMKSTRSVVLAVMVTFSVTWFVHVSSISIDVVIPSWAEAVKVLLAKLIFFGLHGAVVCLALLKPELFPSGKKRDGWSGVVMVWIFMILIHYFAFPQIFWATFSMGDLLKSMPQGF